tara:strand:+ start:642 stop:1142 length:501 start_codon:yes stop_codon:yes gene_type:complete
MSKVKALVSVCMTALICFFLMWSADSLIREHKDAEKDNGAIGLSLRHAGFHSSRLSKWEEDILLLCNNKSLIRVRVNGFKSELSLIVARDKNVIVNFLITDHGETPWLTKFLEDPNNSWHRQYQGITLDSMENIDGITGATITSRAIASALKTALQKEVDSLKCPI